MMYFCQKPEKSAAKSSISVVLPVDTGIQRGKSQLYSGFNVECASSPARC
jgi:hypothetical protein